MKYILERITFFQSDKIKRGDIIVSRILEILMQDRSLIHIPKGKYVNSRHSLYKFTICDRVYLFDTEYGSYVDSCIVKIYEIPEVVDYDFPNQYKHMSHSTYQYSRYLYKKLKKVILKDVDVEIPKIEIPKRFLKDKWFTADLEELSEEKITAMRYNL